MVSNEPRHQWYHEDLPRFRDALTFTEAESGFSSRLIEKDYICTLILQDLSLHFERRLEARSSTTGLTRFSTSSRQNCPLRKTTRSIFRKPSWHFSEGSLRCTPARAAHGGLRSVRFGTSVRHSATNNATPSIAVTKQASHQFTNSALANLPGPMPKPALARAVRADYGDITEIEWDPEKALQ